MATVLLVEDDHVVRGAMLRSLADRGHAVHAVGTALDALRRVAAETPDLVVLDLGLPDLDGADEPFTMTSEIVAVDGDTAVARVEVHYARPQPHEYRDLWVMRFASDGRCREYEEWTFAPSEQTAMSD